MFGHKWVQYTDNGEKCELCGLLRITKTKTKNPNNILYVDYSVFNSPEYLYWSYIENHFLPSDTQCTEQRRVDWIIRQVLEE